jgi:hypothetical protein
MNCCLGMWPRKSQQCGSLPDSLDMEPQTAVEFQKRRGRTWRAVRLWILLGVAGTIGFSIPFWDNAATKCVHHGFGSSKCTLSLDDMPLWQINLCLASFIVIGISVVAVTLAIKHYYRCPRCETVPLGSWSSLGPGNIGMQWGVALNPSVCSKCGAILR